MPMWAFVFLCYKSSFSCHYDCAMITFCFHAPCFALHEDMHKLLLPLVLTSMPNNIKWLMPLGMLDKHKRVKCNK